jgi:hypothetical protein
MPRHNSLVNSEATGNNPCHNSDTDELRKPAFNETSAGFEGYSRHHLPIDRAGEALLFQVIGPLHPASS